LTSAAAARRAWIQFFNTERPKCFSLNREHCFCSAASVQFCTYALGEGSEHKASGTERTREVSTKRCDDSTLFGDQWLRRCDADRGHFNIRLNCVSGTGNQGRQRRRLDPGNVAPSPEDAAARGFCPVFGNTSNRLFEMRIRR